MLTLSDGDFNRLYTYIQQHYGINLSHKKQLITSRLTNMLQQKGFHSFTEYIDEIISGKDPEMVSVMLNKLTTNYTYFMREKEHFAFLQSRILPELAQRHQKDKSLAIWSAGCSSGEEPYTLSIYLKEFFGSHAAAWDTRLLATDISMQALTKARAGIYEKPADIPDTWLRRYFTANPADGTYTVSKVLKDNVVFRTFNLMEPISFRRKFDVIFCRNVMIYFNQATRDALVRRFCDALVPGGYLFISHSESLGQTPLFRMVASAVYQKI